MTFAETIHRTLLFMLAMTATALTAGPISALDIPAQKQPSSAPVELTYLGTAGWIIKGNDMTILVDPYITRLQQGGQPGIGQTAYGSDLPGDSRPPWGDNIPDPDHALIDKLITRADYILVTHAHPDHMLDVPYIANRTHAVVVGNESVTNIARASGVADSNLVTVRGGEDFDFGTYSLRVIDSLHTIIDKSYFDSRSVPRDVKVPLRFRDYVEGGTRAYLIRLNGQQILVFGSGNYIERELSGIRPDVVIVGANKNRRYIYDYAGRLMRALGYPAIVLPTHWDRYSLPYDDPQAANAPEIKKNLEAFTEEIHAVSPSTQVIVPRYYESIRLVVCPE